MSQVTVLTDKLDICQCGNKPDYYSIGYGPTPYSVFCQNCKKSTNRYKSIGGQSQNIIDFWNEIAPLREISTIHSLLTYEYNDKYYVWHEMRSAILNAFEQKIYNRKCYILFANGKIEIDIKRFLNKNDDY